MIDTNLQSLPNSDGIPSHISAIASLFGNKDFVDYKKCKVLEVGCGEGGNLISLAANYPKSEFLGLDENDEKLNKGRLSAEELGLKNIKFKTVKYEKLKKEGEYDYILANRIFSIIEDDLAEKIFKFCSDSLSKDGFLYTSYATKPGWNLLEIVADVARYHIKDIPESDKEAQVGAILQFLKRNINGNYKSIIDSELKEITPFFIHYLLNKEHKARYFEDMVKSAHNNGLMYLSDTNLAAMYIKNYSKEIGEALEPFSTNIVKQEQFLDFINLRKRRSSIFCKQGKTISREVKPENINGLTLSGNMFLKQGQLASKLETDDSLTFNNGQGIEISVKTYEGKALLLMMQELANEYLPFDEIIKRTIKRHKKADKKKLETALQDFGVDLIFAGGIKIEKETFKKIEATDKPKTSELVRWQAKNQNWVTGGRFEYLQIDELNSMVLRHMDGTKTIEDIAKELRPMFFTGKIEIVDPSTQQKIEDEAAFIDSVSIKIKTMIKGYEKAHLIVE